MQSNPRIASRAEEQVAGRQEREKDLVDPLQQQQHPARDSSPLLSDEKEEEEEEKKNEEEDHLPATLADQVTQPGVQCAGAANKAERREPAGADLSLRGSFNFDSLSPCFTVFFFWI